MQLLRKILLTLFVTLIFLGLIEGISWIYISRQADIYQGDLGYFWSLKPNIAQKISQEEYQFMLKTNSLGLRDDELAVKNERWVFLGCSTTLGWGVEKNEGFIDIIDTHLEEVELVNGGQPGWTTQQGLMGIERFKDLKPDRVFVGFGVRDAQLSYREDREARPAPWVFSLNIMKILAKMAPKREQAGGKRRVATQHFERNLKLIQKSFPKAEVYFYSFPQLKREMEYEKVIQGLAGKIPSGFHGGDFFDQDTIHLNKAGNQKLANWFLVNWLPELLPAAKKREHPQTE